MYALYEWKYKRWLVPGGVQSVRDSSQTNPHMHITRVCKCSQIHLTIGATNVGEVRVVSGLYCIFMTVQAQVAVLVPASKSTTLPRTWKSTLAGSKARQNEIVSQSPNLSARGESWLRGLGFKVLLRKVQANRWRGLIKAPFRRGGFAEIDGYISANNRGIPQAVNIASLVRSKAGAESSAERWGGRMGERGEKDFRREFKEFYGQGRRGDCRLDLEGVKLFLLPPLSFFLSPIRAVRKQ